LNKALHSSGNHWKLLQLLPNVSYQTMNLMRQRIFLSIYFCCVWKS